MIVIFDNRRMAAITGLQVAQYGKGFRTSDRVAVDYVRLAGAVDGVRALHGGGSAEELKRALYSAQTHKGLSVVHVPVYCGPHELGGLGAWGEWNVRQLVRRTVQRDGRCDPSNDLLLRPLSERIVHRRTANTISTRAPSGLVNR